ncbi:MAG: acetyl-CoA carboxylase biotin carboxyl carrier protein subunit [Deltaproteobacteria bacterium]|nr:acetyl-CoA carboxylase biotin carboxyl carrier protein subunit [Deltaproteobacteria bacterium]
MKEIISPMGGKVIDIKIQIGDFVNEFDEILTLEAMKMELPIVAESPGTVKEINCIKGNNVETNDVLAVLE